MKLIPSILNERPRFEVNIFNGIYKVNVGKSFKILNNVKSCPLLDVLTLNPDYKIDRILFPHARGVLLPSIYAYLKYRNIFTNI
jgi:hypothetical protein